MRFVLLIIMSAQIVTSVGQEPIDIFFDEISGSMNRSSVHDQNTEDRYGFGLGVYHSFMSDKRVNIAFGREFNQISQFKKHVPGGHYYHNYDVTYISRYISFPLSCRYNIGQKIKLFIEGGAFADLAVGGRHHGTQHSIIPEENGQFKTTIIDFDHRGGLPSSYGVFGGIGVKVPLSRFQIIIRPEYKIGLNEWLINYQEYYNKYFRLSIGIKAD